MVRAGQYELTYHVSQNVGLSPECQLLEFLVLPSLSS